MLTQDAFKNITFQKSRVRAEIGATFEEFVVKLNSTIDKLQDSSASYAFETFIDLTIHIDETLYITRAIHIKPMIDEIVKASESKDDFMTRIARRMQRKEVPFSSSSSHLGTLQN